MKFLLAAAPRSFGDSWRTASSIPRTTALSAGTTFYTTWSLDSIQ